MEKTASFDLERFTVAQEPVYEQVKKELRAGAKKSHWMWFIFPQMYGLGRSAMATKFAIKSREEASAYLDHPVLGKRLRECSELLLGVEGKTAHEIFGFPDDAKLRSSMTLFSAVSEEGSVFHHVLEKFFDGRGCNRTQNILNSEARNGSGF